MKEYQIISDTACDMSVAQMEQMGLHFVPFSISFDGEQYDRDLLDIQRDEFYKKMKDATLFPKTSQPNVKAYIDEFEKSLKKGSDVLCICLSSRLSGSYQSAVNAEYALKEDYPERTILVLDSLCVTGIQNILVCQAVRMQEAGKSLKEAYQTLEAIKTSGKICFTVDSLEHLQKGGRIGKAAALAGNILNVKPIIHIENGELNPDSKVRGMKKAIHTILDNVHKEIGNEKELYEINVLYGSAELLEKAEVIQQELKEKGYFFSDIPVVQLGMTIGAHTGPTSIGICYMKKYECIGTIK